MFSQTLGKLFVVVVISLAIVPLLLLTQTVRSSDTMQEGPIYEDMRDLNHSNRPKSGIAAPLQTYPFEVYNDPNWSGTWCLATEPKSANIHPSCNDQTSSVYLRTGWSVRLYRDQNQGGPSICFNRSDENLNNNTFQDNSPMDNAISSFTLYDQSWCAESPSPAYPLEVYNDANYGGHWCYSTEAKSANIHSSCNDQITSILLRSGWSIRVYRDQNQSGPSRCLNGSDSNLSNNTFEGGSPMNNAISSFTLYDHTDCEGTPTPTPTTKPDLRITALEITQGIQDTSNHMPLITSRWTRARAYVRADLYNVSSVQARIRAFRGGVELSGSPRNANNTITVRTNGGTRTNLNDSFWFYIPPNWRSGTVEFRVEIDPYNNVAESNEGNNTLSRSVTFRNADPLNIVFVPLHLHDYGNRNNPAEVYYAHNNLSSFRSIYRNLYRFHPISELNVWYYKSPLYPTWHGWPFYQEWDVSKGSGWSDILSAVRWKNFWTKDWATNLYWVGMVHPGLPSAYNGIAYRPGSELCTVMSNSHGSYPIWFIRGGNTLAHELGHNKGLRHVNCNNTEANPDPNYPWPYPNCRLAEVNVNGYYGFDVYYQNWNLGSPSVISNDPAAPTLNRAFPLMGYRRPRWISPYEYCKLLPQYGVSCSLSWTYSLNEAKEAAVLVNPLTYANAEALVALRTADEYLAVGGLVTTTNSTTMTMGGFFNGVYRMTEPFTDALQAAEQQLGYASVFNTQSVNEPTFLLAQLSVTNSVLFTQTLFLADADGNDVQSFLELMPMMSGANKVQLRYGDLVLNERIMSTYAPTVTLVAPNGGETLSPGTIIRWQSADIDDPTGEALRFHILYSPDNGNSWHALALNIQGNEWEIPDLSNLPGSDQGRIRVVVNDGFYTAYDDSDATLTVPGNNPFPLVVFPTSGSSFAENEEIYLLGSATDMEDGPLYESDLVWSSDIDGNLGSGSELAIQLSNGAHKIALTATDSEGNVAQDQIVVWVGIDVQRVYLPLVIRE